METILPSLTDKAASPGLAGPDAAQASGGAASSTAAASSSSRGDTVTFSAEALAKAAAMASNAATASNAGAGLDAQGQALGGAGASSQEEDSEADATVAALKARVEQIQEEIKAAEEGDLPRKERDAKLAELRLELLEAQTAYYKAKQQAGGGQDGNASQTAGAMAGLASSAS